MLRGRFPINKTVWVWTLIPFRRWESLSEILVSLSWQGAEVKKGFGGVWLRQGYFKERESNTRDQENSGQKAEVTATQQGLDGIPPQP